MTHRDPDRFALANGWPRRAIAALAMLGCVAALSAACSGTDAATTKRQIEEWGQRWQPLRRCLMGGDLLAPGPQESAWLRSLTEPSYPKSIESCAESGATLQRAKSDHVAEVGIEAAWDDMRKSVERLARAQREAVSGESPAVYLGQQVAAIDRNYDKLRERAGMSAPPLDSGPELPALPAGTALTFADGSPAAPTHVGQPRNNVLRYRSWSGAAPAITTVARPRYVQHLPVGEIVERADDEAAWGVWLDPADGTPRAGALDERGAPVDGGVVLDRRPNLRLLRAAGQGAVRLVALDDYDTASGDADELLPSTLVVLRSTDGGARWKQALATKTLRGAVAVDHGLYWVDERGETQRLLLTPASAAGDVAVRATGLRETSLRDSWNLVCQTERTDWYKSMPDDADRTTVAWHEPGSDKAAAIVPGAFNAETVQCDDEVLYGFDPNGAALHAYGCTRDACKRLGSVPAPPTPAHLALDANHVPVVGLVLEDILFLWEPTAGRLSPAFRMRGRSLHGMMVWDGQRWAVVGTDQGAELVQLSGR